MSDDKPQPRDWLLTFISGGCVVDVLRDLIAEERVAWMLLMLIAVWILLHLRAWHQRTWVRRSQEINR